jgi:hypothetical protein
MALRGKGENTCLTITTNPPNKQITRTTGKNKKQKQIKTKPKTKTKKEEEERKKLRSVATTHQ